MLGEMNPMEVKISVGGKSYTFRDTFGLDDPVDHIKDPTCTVINCVQPEKSAVKTLNHCKPSLKKARRNNGHVVHRLKKSFKAKEGENQIDIYSRGVFPLSYSAFLVIYFVVAFRERLSIY